MTRSPDDEVTVEIAVASSVQVSACPHGNVQIWLFDAGGAPFAVASMPVDTALAVAEDLGGVIEESLNSNLQCMTPEGSA